MSEEKDFIDETYVDGICCNLCKFNETDQCVVDSASSWSRFKNFCSEYRNKDTDRTIRQTFIRRLEVM